MKRLFSAYSNTILFVDGKSTECYIRIALYDPLPTDKFANIKTIFTQTV